MPYVETSDGTSIFYNDWGSGQPVVLIHGWPLDSDMWSDHAVYLAERGFRVIAYDRRGFGRSSQPWSGYDYGTLAADLDTLVKQLHLGSPDIVGFSMGGGEVARYIGKGGTARKAVLVSAVTPFMLKTADNPTGIDKSVFDGILDGLQKDRPHFLVGFAKQFYGQGLLMASVSQETLQWSFQMAMMGSLRATVECAKAFAMTDFRKDLATFRCPTLLIHGTSDATVPIDSSARPASKMIAGAKLIEYDGEPHGLHATAKDRLSQDLADFLAA